MKNLKLLSILFLTVILTVTCKKEDDSENDDFIENRVVVMENSTDPLFFTYQQTSEVSYDYFGERDGAGNPININQIFVRQNDSINKKYYFDEQGLPEKMVSSDGEIQFEWISSSSLIIKLISIDGKYQFVTEIDLNQGSTQNNKSKSTNCIRNNKKIRLEVLPYVLTTAQTKSAQTISDSKCKIFVTRCGEQDNYSSVYVKATTTYPEYKYLGTFPAKKVSNGIYETTLPSSTAPSINLNEQCHNLVNVLSNLCSVHDPYAMQAICTSVSTALAAGIISAPAAAAFGTLCTSANGISTVICTSAGPGAPSLYDLIMEKLEACDVVFEDRTYYSDMVLFPRVVGLPNDISGMPEIVQGSGPYPDLYIEISNETHIRPLIITPTRPLAEQDYTASVEIYCVEAGSNVHLSITGTDGYFDEISYFVSETQAESTYILDVPGAEQGVQDVINLKVDLPNGNEIVQTSSFVFQ
jgi:hypothetical protein